MLFLGLGLYKPENYFLKKISRLTASEPMPPPGECAIVEDAFIKRYGKDAIKDPDAPMFLKELLRSMGMSHYFSSVYTMLHRWGGGRITLDCRQQENLKRVYKWYKLATSDKYGQCYKKYFFNYDLFLEFAMVELLDIPLPYRLASIKCPRRRLEIVGSMRALKPPYWIRRDNPSRRLAFESRTTQTRLERRRVVVQEKPSPSQPVGPE